MKRKEFERRYAARSGITVEQGYDSRIFPAIKCECWDESCEGWRRRYEDDGPPPGKPCKRHAYGGYRAPEPAGSDAAQRRIMPRRGSLICRWCGEEYQPPSAYTVTPINAPEFDCPHPVWGDDSRPLGSDDRFVRTCMVCGKAARFTPVLCVGGPYDGRIEPTLITPDDGTSVGSWRIFSTTVGQEPDENGRTTLFTYTLRFGPDGRPQWEGRSGVERAFDAQAETTA